jgi:hypothetical protein
MLRFLPVGESLIVLAFATVIFGPRTLWRMRLGRRGSHPVD